MDFKFAIAWAYITLALLGAASLTAIFLGYGPPVRSTAQALALGAFAAFIIVGPLVWATLTR